ncbi:hypothetical protein H6G17_28300 [Chroococcidiopsis sp. FACHB-1243]|uniref:hypothetical protein n=1 Tax=Chroococcidiopsis sp. [FACHB-1243] TaxID=2692781 RepID=UPI00177F8537|nr:hypothetical protein [Chroococcidiopsis sp. [FACHB-1243]]MBD2309360.1 hypothetical protein [Chroococcidiopsis sp. [FACHB-1243]]
MSSKFLHRRYFGNREDLREFWGHSWQKLTPKQRELVGKILRNPTSMSPVSKFVELPEKEVSAKTGVFLNPVTEAVWELTVKEGKLIVAVPNFSFQISPFSPNKFIPVNTSIDLKIEFEKHGQNNPLLMHLYAKGIKRATFEPL